MPSLAAFPEDVVLDGEILGWHFEGGDGRARAFPELQKRLGRKRPTPAMIGQFPVAYVIFDVLYSGHELLIDRPLRERAAILDALFAWLRYPEDSAADAAQRTVELRRGQRSSAPGASAARSFGPRRLGRSTRRVVRPCPGARQRRADDQGRRFDLYSRPPRPIVDQTEARTRHPGRRGHRGRVRPRQTRGRAQRLYLRGAQWRSTAERRQSLYGADRRRDRDDVDMVSGTHHRRSRDTRGWWNRRSLSKWLSTP